MEWNKQKIKGLLLVVCGGVAFYCALQRLDAVLAALGWLLGIWRRFCWAAPGLYPEGAHGGPSSGTCSPETGRAQSSAAPWPWC